MNVSRLNIPRPLSLTNVSLALGLLLFATGCASYPSWDDVIQSDTYSVKKVSRASKVASIDFTSYGNSGGLSSMASRTEEEMAFGPQGEDRAVKTVGGVDRESRVLLYNALATALAQEFDVVVEREELDELIEEHGLARKDFTALTDHEKAITLAKLLGADYLVDAEILTNDVSYQYRFRDIDKVLVMLPYIGPLFGVMHLAMGKTPAEMERYNNLANKAGIPLKTSKFDLDASSFSGVSLRMIDVATGKIAFIGYAVKAEFYPEMAVSDVEQMTKYENLRVLCQKLLERAK